MQNTPQTFRGTAAPGANYSDHTYDNHIGNHCQSSGYQQPYSNQLYHPRPHHYGNHQMQQNMQYRHHGGGNYGPNQNQYGQAVNQDLYRNNHPNYAGNNNRIPTKTWTDNNNSNDLMPPYGQVSPHTQMMNNPPQMPVTTMRSPPHAASNMNQGASQGQQHFRPMQSPAHSPHSWSQAQIPSPGMMHSPRTSPLPAHVRSPGHSQPFSPPAAHSINMPPHQHPQENGQISQPINSSNDNPSNPLHSLQKMVLLEQDPKAMMALPGNEQYQNQCSSHSFVPEDGITNDSPKESQYSTYYNMDEDRFESKPNNDSSDSAIYSSPHSMTNCNFPVPSHPSNNEIDLKNIARVPGNLNPNIPEAFHSSSNQNSVPSQINSALEQSHCKSSIPQSDCSSKQNECPPHAESAPLFTDQTKAAVSTNTEQALESKSSSNWVADASDPEKASVAQVSFADAAGTPHSSISQERCVAFQPSPDNSSKENSSKESDISNVNNDKLSKEHENYTLTQKECKSESDSEKNNQAMQNPSICTLSSESQDCDSNMTSSDSKSCSSYEDSHGSEKKNTNSNKIDDNDEDAQSLGMEDRSNSQPESCNPKVSSNESGSSSNPSPSSNVKCDIDSNLISRTPVKVVIHRIRKSDTHDTWHVPGNTTKSNEIESEKENLTESKPNVGPQIIMLSQAVSEKNVRNLVSENNIDEIEINLSATVKEEPMDSSEKNSNTDKNNANADKKRGRPAGSKNRMKAISPGVRNKRGKKGAKKKKGENSKQKLSEIIAKVKKAKVFNGPYVHIIGSKENPSAISIVNVAQKEDEKLSKTQTKRNISTAISRIKNKTVGHLSTLSPTYDAYNRDKTWVCIFCQKGSHHGGLGDLYGPYYIKNNSEEKQFPSTSGTCASRNKRKKSETEDPKTPKRAKQSPAQPTPINQSQNADEETEKNLKEVWIHEDCAVWCQNVTLIGEEVRGLEEAVNEAHENKCHKCSFHGATLGCWGKGCKEMYHYTCAKETGCQLDIEKFSLLCPRHQKKSPEIQKRCQ